MSEVDPEVEEEPRRTPRRTRLFKKLKDWWGKITFVVTIVGTVVGGVVWVDDKLDEYAQRAVDLADLKASNAAIRAEQDVINERITDSVTNATKQITTEFETRDTVDRELRANILAVLNEMRARHGVVTLAQPTGGGRPIRRRIPIQEAQEEADHATIRSGNALPQDDPLSGLGGF